MPKKLNTSSKENGVSAADSPRQVFQRLIVRHCGNAHPHICRYFVEARGFVDLCRLPYHCGTKSKLAHFRDLAVDLFFVVKNLRRIRQAREIIALGMMTNHIAWLLKLGLLPSCRRLYWFGLFIHSPRWLRRLRPAFQLLDSPKCRYILFSNYEKGLYAQALRLPEERMFYVPYGDLSEPKPSSLAPEVQLLKELGEGQFYFSGGGSNRDYPSLIEIFRGLRYPLVIICSSLNTDVDESAAPPNVKILRDLPSEVFDVYVKAAKACIIPIAHDTGAAGQSCLLRYMKNRKVIIATNTGIIREYIEDGVSGILVKNNREAMASAIAAVEANPERYRGYAAAACERFVNFFSGEAIQRKLNQMLNQEQNCSRPGLIQGPGNSKSRH